MMVIDSNATKVFEEAVDSRIKSLTAKRSTTHVAEVLEIDNEGTVWVHIFGGANRTPATSTLASVSQGDIVTATIDDGVVTINGSTSSPAASVNYVDEANLAIAEYAKSALAAAVSDIIRVKVLVADKASIEDLTATNATIQTLTASYANLNELVAGKADISYLSANYAHITNGVIDNATIDYADVNNVHVTTAQIDDAAITSAKIENAAITSAKIADEAVESSKILSVSANKLTAGTINAAEIDVVNLRASSLIVDKINGQPVLGGYSAVSRNISGYSGKDPSSEGWYELTSEGFVLSEDTEVDPAKAYYVSGTATAIYDQAYIDDLTDVLNERIDGTIETFTGDVVPTLLNYPAVDWSTDAMKDEHVGDIYYVINAASQADGYCYRFAKVHDNQTGTDSYTWILIKDSDVTKALQDIIDVQGWIGDTDVIEGHTDIASWMTDTDAELSSTKSSVTSLQTALGTKVDTSTFNTLSQTVDQNSSTITQLSTVVEGLQDGADLIASGEGATVTVADSAGLPMFGLSGEGYAHQDGTPAPDSPIPVEVCAGRNLLPSDKHLVGNEIIFGASNHTTPSAHLLPGTYTVSGAESGGGTSTNFYVKDIDTNTNIVAGGLTFPYTFTVSEECDASIWVYKSTYTSADDIAWVQLERGSTAHPYLPYGYVGLEVEAVNKFDKSLIVNPVSTAIQKVVLYLKPNTTYTASTDLAYDGGGAALFFLVENKGSVSTATDGFYQGKTLTLTTGPTGYVDVRYRLIDNITADVLLAANIQIEEGSTATEFRPYSPDSTTPIPLPSKGFAGALPDGTCDALSIDSAGKWEWKANVGKYVLDGTETWRISGTSGTANWYYIINSSALGIKGSSTLMSNHYTNAFIADSSTEDGIGTISSGAQIRVRYGTEGSPADFAASHATNPLDVFFALATPTVESGYIDLPALPEGAEVSIPELESIGVQWWTEAGYAAGKAHNDELVSPEVADLTTRVTQAETSITQNSNEISLRATKTEAYQYSQPNLTPFFAHDKSDVYGTGNTGAYWRDVGVSTGITTWEFGKTTGFGDGWAHIVASNTGSSMVYARFYVNKLAQSLKPSTKYTFLIEVADCTLSSGQFYVAPTTAHGGTDGQNNDFFATGTLQTMTASTSYSKYYLTSTTKAAYQSASNQLFRGLVGVGAGCSMDAYIRVSVYEGDYTGPYKPCVDWTISDRISDFEAELVITNDSISSKVSANGVISAINQSAESITIDANRVNIAGAAVFGNYSTTTQMNNAIATAVDNVSVGGRNLLRGTQDGTGRSAGVASKISDIYSNCNVWTYTKSDSSTYYDLVRFNDFITPEPSSDYTLSFWAKADASVEVHSYFYPSLVQSGHNSAGNTTTSPDGAISLNLSTSWKRYWVTWTTNSTTTGTKHLIPIRMNASAANTKVYFAGIKFERGNKATDWTAAPEDLTVGGRNLLKNSLALTSPWVLNQAAVSNGVVTVTPTANSDRRMYQMPADGYWSWEPSTQYTASVEARSDNSATLQIMPNGANASYQNYTVTSDWKRYSYSFISSATVGTASMTFALAESGKTIQLRRPKLEKGSQATDWTPAPEDANDQEQLIYISKASGTSSVSANTTWVTATSDSQNTWTTKRPTYSSSYPVLFVATQRKTVGGTVTCTTPLKDDTTTVIDGGHITTGTIDASKATITNINASNISSGTLSADRIAAGSLSLSKIVTSDQENILNSNVRIGGRNLLTASDIYCYTAAQNSYLNKSLYVSSGTVKYARPAQTNEGFYITNAAKQEIGESYTVHFDISDSLGAVKNFYIYSDTGKIIGGALSDISVYIDGALSGTGTNVHACDLSNGAVKHVEVRFTVKGANTSTYKGLILQAYKGTATAFNITVANLKWEKGNKATDWTPAQEDVTTEAYQYSQPNLTPYLSMSVTDKEFWVSLDGWGGVESNTEGTNQVTNLGDGWARAVMDSRTSAGNQNKTNFLNIQIKAGELHIEEGKSYTWLIEVVINTWTPASSSSHLYARPSVGDSTADKLGDTGSIAVEGGGVFYKTVAAKASFSNVTAKDTRGYFYMPTGCYADFNLRVSLYEGVYSGPYKPYSGDQLYALQVDLLAQSTRLTQAETNISQNTGAIALRATKTEVTSLSNSLANAEVSISNVSDRTTALEVKADSFTVTQSKVDTIDGQVKSVMSRMSFSDGALSIDATAGANATATKAVLTSTKLAFEEAGVEVASIGDGKLNIENAEVHGTLAFGGFAFIPRSNGNLSLKWIGD